MSVGTRPLVNVWIPSVFLRGRSSNVHHVYQVNGIFLQVVFIRTRKTEKYVTDLVSIFTRECANSSPILALLLWSFSTRRFEATDGNQELAVLLFHLSSHYHIWVGKCRCLVPTLIQTPTLIQIVEYLSLAETISLKILERPLSWLTKCSLPVSVGGSSTSLALALC